MVNYDNEFDSSTKARHKSMDHEVDKALDETEKEAKKWLLKQLKKDIPSAHQTGRYIIADDKDEEKLEKALDELVKSGRYSEHYAKILKTKLGALKL